MPDPTHVFVQVLSKILGHASIIQHSNFVSRHNSTSLMFFKAPKPLQKLLLWDLGNVEADTKNTKRLLWCVALEKTKQLCLLVLTFTKLLCWALEADHLLMLSERWSEDYSSRELLTSFVHVTASVLCIFFFILACT